MLVLLPKRDILLLHCCCCLTLVFRVKTSLNNLIFWWYTSSNDNILKFKELCLKCWVDFKQFTYKNGFWKLIILSLFARCCWFESKDKTGWRKRCYFMQSIKLTRKYCEIWVQEFNAILTITKLWEVCILISKDWFM